ncbi:MAG: succinate dehydrogenase iron-sulfur subunit [Acidobacteria bacterium]|nr:succinate dehydrogenase iron-sulfur subunit [Acidobacteriota bacterium]
MAEKTVRLKIKRQLNAESSPFWEEFEIPHGPSMNVISCLVAIQEHPVTRSGKKTTAVAWECSCLEEVCGACTMIINGMVRQACSALVDNIDQPIVLEPMTKFPVVRDLVVDRQRMFDNLKKVQAWVPVDGSFDMGPGPKLEESERAVHYELSKCMTCGCCLEVCPQFEKGNDFMGAQIISQVRLFNFHPTGAALKEDRLHSVMGKGGVAECGNAQNCVEACPKEIPLTTSIAEVGRQVTLQVMKDWFRK